MKIIVVGKNSFLAKSLAKNTLTTDWVFLSHQEISDHQEFLQGADVVINCAFHPDLKAGPYESQKDIDHSLALAIQKANAHFIMLSSRLVYGRRPENMRLKESDIANPQSDYARAKYQTELSLAHILNPDRLTILRMGNIFGAEYGRKTFIGHALSTLKDRGEIIFDMPPESIRDFRSAQSWAEAVIKITQNPKGGLYNMGAGFGISARDIAQIMIAAHGQGELIVRAEKPLDSFFLDMAKTNAQFSLAPYTKADLVADLQAIP